MMTTTAATTARRVSVASVRLSFSSVAAPGVGEEERGQRPARWRQQVIDRPTSDGRDTRNERVIPDRISISIRIS